MADAECTSSKQDIVPQQKYDDDGEPILAEGICYNSARVFFEVFMSIFAFSGLVILIFVPFLPFLFIIALYCAYKAASSWRLYLAPSGIHQTKVAVSPCCYKKIFIPLADIESISANVVPGKDMDFVPVLQVRVKSRRLLEENTPLCQRIFWGINEYLKLKNVSNAVEFAAAVEQQLSVGAAT